MSWPGSFTLPCEDGVILRRDTSERNRVYGISPIFPEVEMSNSDWCSRRAAKPFVLVVMLSVLLLQELTLLFRRLEIAGYLPFSPLHRLAAPLHMFWNLTASGKTEAGERTKQQACRDGTGVGPEEHSGALDATLQARTAS